MILLVTTPSLDDMVLPTEQVLFRSSRDGRTAIVWGLSVFVATFCGVWIVSGLGSKGVAAGLGFGSLAAVGIAMHLQKAQVLITDKRLLIRAGAPLAWDLVTHLGAIACIERDYHGRLEIVCRDGERTRIDELPELAGMISIIVDRTGVDAPVMLPPRLKPWGALARTFWAIGAVAGLVLPWFTVLSISRGYCGGPCFAEPGQLEIAAILVLMLPFAILGGAVGTVILAAILRLALAVADARLVFDATLQPPKSVGRFNRVTIKTLYFPAIAARFVASWLYGERI